MLFTILGFRTTTKTVLLAMTTSAFTMIFWDHYFQFFLPISNIAPATFINFLTLISCHYFFSQPSNSLSLQEQKPPDVTKLNNKQQANKILNLLKKLLYKLSWKHIIDHCINNSFTNKHNYAYFPIFILLSLIIMISSSTSKNLLLHSNLKAISFLVASSSTLTTAFIVYKLWPTNFYKKYIGFIWYIYIFYSLVFTNTILILISGLTQVPLICFLLNLILVTTVIRLYVALIMIIIGIPLGILSFNIIYYY